LNRLGRRDGLALLVVLILLAIAIAIVGAEGDFPLNDDWSYARGVASVIEQGTLQLDRWPAMTLIAQTAVGIGFAEVFGFSFTTLRWATLVSSGLHLIVFYLLLRRFGGVWPALLLTVLLLFNPLYFSLSFSWMTEVHYLLGVTGASYFFVRYCSRPEWKWLLAATALSAFAVLVRQFAILLPLAFGFVLLFRPTGWLRRGAGFIPFVVSICCLLGYQYWLANAFPELNKVGGVGELLNNAMGKSWYWWSRSLVALLLYPGLFLLPIAIPLAAGLGRRLFRRPVITLLILLPLAGFLIGYHHHFPAGNVLYNLGIGPRLLKGTYHYPDVLYPTIDAGTWQRLNYLAITGTCLLALILLNGRPFSGKIQSSGLRWDSRTAARIAIALYGLGYYVLVSAVNSLYDRYALPLLPVLAVLIVGSYRRAPVWAAVLGGAVGVMLTVYAVGGTHDYLAWNRARYQAYQELNEDQGVPITSIDAGFELNAWNYDGVAPTGGNGRSWWFVTDDEFIIAFVKPRGYEAVAAYPFRPLLPGPFDTIYTYRRQRPKE
jgi:4-amino-4-deoxy-L-arabinose transferase-like glycosyltransferase